MEHARAENPSIFFYVRPCVLAFALAFTFANTACLEFQANPLDKSNGGLIGNLLISQAIATSGGDGGTTTSTQIRFVILGDGGKGFTSLDGSTWTELDAAGNTNIVFKKVIWTGTRWVAAGEDTSATAPAIYYSSDGESWTAASMPSPCGAATRTLNDLVLGGTTLMAVGQSDTLVPCVLTSADDGSTWAQTPSTAGGTPYSHVAYDGTNFYVSQPSAASAAPQIQASNGTAPFAATGTRPNITGGLGGSSTGELFGNGANLIFVGLDSNSSLADSSHSTSLGATWTADATAIFDSAAGLAPRALAVNGSRIVAVGDGCRVDYSDDNALNWNFNGALPACSGVAFADVVHDATTSTFIAAGVKSAQGEIWTSTDNGLTWSALQSGLTHTTPRTIAVRP